MKYLGVSGELFRDNRLELRPCFVTDRAHGALPGTDEVVDVELRGAEGNVLLRHRLPLREVCSFGGSGHRSEMSLSGAVPFPDETRQVRFFRGDVLLRELEVGPAPVVTLLWEPSARVAGKKAIRWKTEGPRSRGRPPARLQYSRDDGDSWTTIALPSGNRHTVDFDMLPGGRACRLRVLVASQLATASVTSRRFSVKDKPCQAMILQPEDRAVVASGEPVLLVGQACYLEGRTREDDVRWESSIDGKLGAGLMLSSTSLSVGTHTLTFTAGRGARRGVDTCTLTVRKPRSPSGGAESAS